jgi:DNA processing protein
MSLIKRHTEIEFALIAQQIRALTLSVQIRILDYSETYANLFIGPSTLFPVSMRDHISLIREKYDAQDWSDVLSKNHDALYRINGRAIPRTSSEYPLLLKQTSRAPSILYVRGSAEQLHMPQIAIVGSRRMTRVGQQNALGWSRFLANSGFTVTSGLALGIDGTAHQGALQASSGGTIAVMATGIDKIYPKQHEFLAEQIVDAGGCLVTEFALGTEPLAQHFPQRNRIISGLSLGVLVVEAALKSGSLITIHNSQSKGCHALIKQGAILAEKADDIVIELKGALAGLREHLPPVNIESAFAVDFDEDQRTLLAIIGFDPIDLDSLSRATSWPAEKLSQVLVCLELCRAIDNNNGFYQRLL